LLLGCLFFFCEIIKPKKEKEKKRKKKKELPKFTLYFTKGNEADI